MKLSFNQGNYISDQNRSEKLSRDGYISQTIACKILENSLSASIFCFGAFPLLAQTALGPCSGTGKELLNPSSKNLHSQWIPIILNVLTILFRLEMSNILKFSNLIHNSEINIFSSFILLTKTKQNKTKALFELPSAPSSINRRWSRIFSNLNLNQNHMEGLLVQISELYS